MTRKDFLKYALLLPAAPLALSACGRTRSHPSDAAPPSDSLHVHDPTESFGTLEKSDEAWREILSEDEFHILFEEGTERPHTSPLLDEERDGTYICAACYLPLFPSTTKYESGTGWPSFWAPLSDDQLGTKRDTKLAVPRTEYHCARCGGHQGHVFEDGPDPTGLRYCNNGLALNFVPEDEDLPPLRSQS